MEECIVFGSCALSCHVPASASSASRSDFNFECHSIHSLSQFTVNVYNSYLIWDSISSFVWEHGAVCDWRAILDVVCACVLRTRHRAPFQMPKCRACCRWWWVSLESMLCAMSVLCTLWGSCVCVCLVERRMQFYTHLYAMRVRFAFVHKLQKI